MKRFEVVKLSPDIYLKVFWRTNGRDALLNPPAAPSRRSVESKHEGSHDAAAARHTSVTLLVLCNQRSQGTSVRPTFGVD